MSEQATLYWWEAFSDGGVMVLVAAATPERAIELVQWQELASSRLTALDVADLADGPLALADTVHHGKWELDAPDDIPVEPPWEGIYYTDTGQ